MNRVILDQKRESYRVSIRKEWRLEMQRKKREKLQEVQQDNQAHKQRLIQAIHEHIDKDFQPTIQPKALTYFQHLQLTIQKPTNDPISISFLYLISQELYQQPKQCTTEILDYVFQFIRNNRYIDMKPYKKFKKNFLNLLTIIVWEVNRPEVEQLKKQLLKWCTGTHCISVLTHCISQFPNIKQYPQLYKLLEKGLTKKQSEEAAQTIISIGKSADWDDLYSIYLNFPDIFNNLLENVVKCNKPDKKILYGEAMIRLCQTYEEIIKHYTLCGMGQLACQLVLSQTDAEISMGLRMLYIICALKDKEIRNYLLYNQKVQSCKMWQRIASLHTSQNIEHRRGIYKCLLYFADNLTHQEMSTEFIRVINCDIMDIVDYGLKHQDNPSIVLSILQLIRILLYHSELLKEVHHVNVVAMSMAKRGLFKIIQEHSISECSSIQDSCQAILKGCQRSHIEF